MANVNDNFFDGYYKDVWKNFIPAQLTEKEVEFMIPYFNLKEGDMVLDLMCGYGRHAVALAKKGMKLTAVDNLPEYIDEINYNTIQENLDIDAICTGVLDFATDKKFDLVLCMGNSINFFNAADTVRILRNISGVLKTGGHLLINSWSLAEIIYRSFKETSNSTIGGIDFKTESQVLFHPTRMEAESTFTTKDGATETKKGVDYIYSINEMESMISEAGLTLKEIYSIPGRKKFALGEPRAYIIAQK